MSLLIPESTQKDYHGKEQHSTNISLNFQMKELQRKILNLKNRYCIKSVAVVWSVESLPSNPAGSGILIYVLGLDVRPLSVFCPVLSSAEALTLC